MDSIKQKFTKYSIISNGAITAGLGIILMSINDKPLSFLTTFLLVLVGILLFMSGNATILSTFIKVEGNSVEEEHNDNIATLLEMFNKERLENEEKAKPLITKIQEQNKAIRYLEDKVERQFRKIKDLHNFLDSKEIGKEYLDWKMDDK